MGNWKGKTHLASATLNHARKHYGGQFCTLKDLEELFRKIKSFDIPKEMQPGLQDEYDRLKFIKFLVIDEFNEIQRFYLGELQNFLEARINADLKTIVTTRHDWAELKKLFGEIIVERLQCKTKEII